MVLAHVSSKPSSSARARSNASTRTGRKRCRKSGNKAAARSGVSRSSWEVGEHSFLQRPLILGDLAPAPLRGIKFPLRRMGLEQGREQRRTETTS